MLLKTHDGKQETLRGTGGAAKKTRPLAGFVVAGVSLAALFALAALKGRVKDRR
jgi:hypothetical protein